MEFPAGIIRKAQPGRAPRLFCEIPAQMVPKSPLDVALGLGFIHRRSVHPTDGFGGDENPTEPRHAVSSPDCEATTSGTECASEVAVRNGAWDEEETCGGSASHPRKESGWGEHNDDTGDGTRNANDIIGMDPEPNMKEGAVAPNADLHADVDGDGMVIAGPGERRGAKCSRGTCMSPERGGVPAGHRQQTAVKIVSAASYYRERAAKAGAGSRVGEGNSATRGRALCRIEAFVIRSRSARSARAAPIQQQQQHHQSEAIEKTMAATWYREVLG